MTTENVKQEVPIESGDDEELLREFVGVLQRVYPQFYGEYTPERMRQPTTDYAVNTFIDFVQTDPEGFVQDMKSRGRTPDTEYLLRATGANDIDLLDIYGGENEKFDWQDWDKMLDIRYKYQVAQGQVVGERYLFPALEASQRMFENVGITTRGLVTGQATRLETQASTLTNQYITGLISYDEYSSRIETVNEKAEKIETEYENLPVWQQLLWELPAYYQMPLAVARSSWNIFLNQAFKRAFRNWAKSLGYEISASTEANFLNWARVNVPARYKISEVFNYFIRPKNGLYTITDDVAREAYGTANNMAKQYLVKFTPGGSAAVGQKVSLAEMISQGRAVLINQSTWDAMSLSERTERVLSKGLPADLADKNWLDLTSKEIDIIQEITPADALIREGEGIIAEAKAIEPDAEAIAKFSASLEKAKLATTSEEKLSALREMEALEDEIKAIAKAETAEPPPDEPIPDEILDNIPVIKEVGALERIRPSRKVFEKMGLGEEIWRPAFKAETELGEARRVFNKELSEWSELIGKSKARRILIFDAIDNPELGTYEQLTFNEKRFVGWLKERFDSWADTLDIPPEKRLDNYITHIFEADITQELKLKHPLDSEIIKAMDYISPKKVFNPYLQKRIGREAGLRRDPFAAISAYESRELKVFYYDPLLKKIQLYRKYAPPNASRYLKGFAERMTNTPANIDREINKTLSDVSNKISKLPGGKEIAEYFTRGNPGGLAAYNLTSILYLMWLGFKPTSAIRNLSQHLLHLAETGPVSFADGLRLRFTKEGRDALAKSLVVRSRKAAFVPAIDSSFTSRWTDKVRETALWMFRKADEQNVKDAFLAGYSEAKSLFPDAPEEIWIARGDEVAADTQYLYTRMNAPSWSQNSIGRVFSMLTTWTENWMELLVKWASKRPSKVYENYTKQTGSSMPKKNWSQTYKAILLYLAIGGLAYYIQDQTRVRSWEYTGVTSLNYLADVIGGEFPALEYPGAVADLVAGLVTGDEYRINEGWGNLKPENMLSAAKQIAYVASGERDWLTLFFYLEGEDFIIKKLKERWEKDFEEYPLFEENQEYIDWINANPDKATWSKTKIREEWRKDNPLIEAKMFVTNRFETLSSDEAREEVLRLVDEYDIDTELIRGYDKIFSADIEKEASDLQSRIGNLEKLEVDKPASYLTLNNFATEIDSMVDKYGRFAIEKHGGEMAVEFLHNQDEIAVYETIEDEDVRTLYRQEHPDIEAMLYIWGKVSSFKNPKSAQYVIDFLEKYDLEPQSVKAFEQDPDRYDEIFTEVFQIKMRWFDIDSLYENYGNPASPLYLSDKIDPLTGKSLRQIFRDKLADENPEWVDDYRRVDAIQHNGEKYKEKWVERGHIIDKYGSSSAESIMFLVDNPDVHQWALKEKILTDEGEDWNIPSLRIDVEWRDYDDSYNAIQDENPRIQTEKREQYLKDNPEYATARRKREAYNIRHPDNYFVKFPEEMIDTYVQWYNDEKLQKPDDWTNSLGDDLPFYEDDWFLIDNPEFYHAMVDFGILKPYTEEELNKLPTKEIFEKYVTYTETTLGKPRDDYRWENQDLDAWLFLTGKVSVPITEKRRRAALTPREKFLEDLNKKQKEFKEAIDKLKELWLKLK